MITSATIAHIVLHDHSLQELLEINKSGQMNAVIDQARANLQSICQPDTKIALSKPAARRLIERSLREKLVSFGTGRESELMIEYGLLQ